MSARPLVFLALPLLLAVGCDDKSSDTSAPVGNDGGGGTDSADSGEPPDPNDVDGDGHIAQSAGGDDCDDEDGSIYPGADEYCDEVDHDCDGAVDESGAVDAVTWYVDGDEDGFGLDLGSFVDCDALPGLVDIGGDCDDDDENVYPGAQEICDGKDSDCDGLGDEEDDDLWQTWYPDADGDGYGVPGDTIESGGCDAPDGYGYNPDDCDDNAPYTYPGAPEVCDGVSNDCDDPDASEDGAISVDYAENHGTIEIALDHAAAGSTVSICPGTYVGNYTVDVDLTFVAPYGPESTILESDGTGSVLQVIDGATFTLDGFTITGGSGSISALSPDFRVGGGLNGAEAGPMTIRNSIFDGNTATYGGGMIGNYSSYLGYWDGDVIEDCVFQNGQANSSSGGAHIFVGSISNTQFIDNTAEYAGAVMMEFGPLELTDVTATGNTGRSYGGAFLAYAGDFSMVGGTLEGNYSQYGGVLFGQADTSLIYEPSVTFDGVTMTGNSANYGAITYMQYGDFTVRDAVVTENDALYYGGLGYIYYSDLTIESTEISYNTAGYYGGLAYAYQANTVITDSLITGNESAQYAGGLYVYYGTLDIQDSEISDNYAPYSGGGAYIYYATMNAVNTDFINNEAGQYGGGLYGYYSTALNITGGSVAGNTAGYGAGGAYLYASYLTSDSVDWGSDAAKNDNSPDDLYLAYSGATYSDFGAKTSFYCDYYDCE